MCGIVGYIGPKEAAPFLLEGLSELEYRGYDSAGIAVFDGNRIDVEKSVGRLAVLEKKVEKKEEPEIKKNYEMMDIISPMFGMHEEKKRNS